MSDPNATWLPNLVGGVSIWKLAVDLNEPKFFGGALLVPETEGSDSLPATVRWDLTGLVPLSQARAQFPADTDAALGDFRGALERVAKVFGTPGSGFDKYKEAFTVPAQGAEGCYFYSPEQKKIFVINWGASPRSMGGKAEYVFGYEDWNKAFAGKSLPASAPMLAAAAGGAAVAAAATEAKKEEDPKKKEPANARPWWMWPLFALVAIALVLLALLLLKSCKESDNRAGADAAAEAAAEAGVDAASDAAVDGGGEAGADAAVTDAGDGGLDGGADAGDGGADAGDGGLATNDDGDDDDPDDADPIEGGSSSSGGTFSTKSGKTVVVTLGGAGTNGAKVGPHRRHYQKNAVKWRVAAGNDKVSRMEQRGQRYDVWLGPGKTFEGVKVEWQDKAGKWHPH